MIDPFDFDEGTSNRVERDYLNRPKIWIDCPDSGEMVLWYDLIRKETREIAKCVAGRTLGKKAPRSVKCQKCNGKGRRLVSFARCTTFVDALEDTTSVSKWRARVQLIGLALDTKFGLMNKVESLLDADFDDKATRDALNKVAEQAFLIGDRAEKSQRGTNLHALSEYVDASLDLPAAMPDRFGELRPVTAQDRADMGAWVKIVKKFGLVFDSSECFVVNDEYRTAGTYDRRGRITKTPDGNPFCKFCDRPTIMDLKTGRVDYGAGKIAQQLAVYANASDYDPATGTRTPQDVCTHVGLVINLPQGTGQAKALCVDLVEGYKAVALSAQVREHRNISKKWLVEL